MKWHERLFALLLIFLPTQLGFHFWPEWSMVLGRKIDYLSPTVYFTDIIIFFVLFFWFVEVRPKFRLQILVPIIVLVAINIWVSENQAVAMYKWTKVLEFGLLGFYIVRTKPRASFVMWNLSFGIVYSSLIAIGQFMVQHSLGGIFWWIGERTFNVDTPGIARVSWSGREMLRGYGTFPHPNVLGGFLAVTLPLLLRLKKSKWLYLTFSAGAIALVLTFSRSAWLVAALGVLLTMKKKTLLFYFVIFAVLTAVLVNFNPREESVFVRQQLNDAALTLWQQSPIVGVGLGNFLLRLPQVATTRTIYFLQPVHNIYLLGLAEAGVIGFIFFAWLVWKRRSRTLVMLLLLGLVDHYLLTLEQGQLLFTLVLALSTILP